MPSAASSSSSSPSTSRAAFRFALRVYWEDTDAGGVVFYANYVKFFERARTEWLRSFGQQQERLRLETGAIFVVTDTQLRYLRPARLDDLLSVTVNVKHAGRAQMTIAQQAWCGDALLAESTIRIGCVSAETFKPRRIPTAIFDAIDLTDSANSTNSADPTAGLPIAPQSNPQMFNPS